ncbi:MAG: hypothetical protein NT040_03430 [Bacteroidetes bacterium]|nr:hypothetical protein [Bacteroidota bacterium]
MNHRIILVFLFLFQALPFFGQVNADLSKLIDSLKVADQEWRNLSSRVYKHEIDTVTIEICMMHVSKTDSLNYLVIKPLFDKYGYPGYDQVGDQSSHNFWLLVQHADFHPDFQESVLVKMKAEADKGNASLKDYAYLYDRVKVNSGKFQLYGTQMTLDSLQMSYKPDPVADPEKLNERRKQVGLSTIEDYIRIMNDNFLERKK